MPKPLSSSAKEIIYKVIKFCQREKAEQRDLVNKNKVTERVYAMTGVSRVTLARIKKEASVNNGVWRTPGKGRGSKNGRPLKINLDD